VGQYDGLVVGFSAWCRDGPNLPISGEKSLPRVLVTGGAGMIGGHAVTLLCAKGHEVTVIDDLTAGRREHVPAGVRFLVGSILNDHDLELAFATTPEYVLHLAASFANQRSVDDPENDLTVNGHGSLRVLKFCAKYDVRKVLFASSSCVYGNKDVMRETNNDYRPTTPYAMTKLLGEQYARFYAEQYGLNALVARLFNVYGPNEYPERYRNVIPKFLADAIQGNPLCITGSGEEVRDFTFVSDIVDGICLALFSHSQPGEVFNIARGHGTSIMGLATTINELTRNKAGVIIKPRRNWDVVQKRIGIIQKASVSLGYQPKIDLHEGLTKTAKWLSGTLACNPSRKVSDCS
jgi:nucleoside-diphosphate-sugar epimerase